MKITKDMKKALSALLAAALVVTGAPVQNAQAEEAASTLYLCDAALEGFDGNGTYTADVTSSLKNEWSGNFGWLCYDKEFEVSDVSVKVNDKYTFTFDGIAVEEKVNPDETDKNNHKNYYDVGATFYSYSLPNIWGTTLPVTSDDDAATVKKDGYFAKLFVGDAEEATEITSAKLTFTFAVKEEEEVVEPSGEPGESDVTSESAISSESAVSSEPAVSEEPVESEEPADTPAPLGDNEYEVVMSYVSGSESGHTDWADQAWNADSVVVDMDNLKDSYELSYMATVDSEYLGMGMLEVPKITDAKQVAEFGGFFKLVPTAVKVNETEYAIDYNVNSTCYKDGVATNGMRWNLVNEYNNYCTYDAEADEFTDALDDEGETASVNNVPDAINVTAGDTVSYVFTVENVATDTPEETAAPATDSAVTTQTAVATAKPATKAAATKGAATPSSLTCKKKVVVASGKTKSVALTVVPSTFTAITATSANEKLVTVSTAAGVVNITAAKVKANQKGKKVKVTVAAADKTQVITVAIQNKAKKLKAAKKTVSVKAKKTAKVVFKVKKAENKKAAVTDLFAKSAKKAKKAAKISKVAKVKKVTVKKGKVIVKIKATKKKGTKKLTLKLNKKAKATCKVKVK